MAAVKGKKRWVPVLLFLLLAAMVLAGALFSGQLSGENLSADPQALGQRLGVLTLIPPLITVVLAFATKEVISSLVAGAASGIVLLTAVQGTPGGIGRFALSVLHQFCQTMIGVLSQRENCAIVVLCLVIGGLTAVIRVAGGFQALARRLVKHVTTPRKAQLMGELLGVIVFFDDYANSLIVGPVMRPITDRVGVSREKLSFLVDSTAAPVAGIAIISSWIAAELAAIEAGFDIAGVQASAYSTFLSSIPFCFYNLFCLTFIFLAILSRRDYGPMYHAEVRALKGQTVPPNSPSEYEADPIAKDKEGKPVASLVIAVGSILFLCAYAIIGFYVTGGQAAVAEGLLSPAAPFSLDKVRIAFGCADTVSILVEAAVLTSILALAAGVLTRSFQFTVGVNAWLQGAGELLFTAVILALAWSLSEIIGRVGTVYFLSDLIAAGLPFWLLPTLIFLICCIISFAAGSYGCMLMVMPMAIPIVTAVISGAGSAIRNPEDFLACCVASVLAGSIFGDHCSPVTDTTILSAQGSGCNLLDHVKTQLPYAMTVAAVSTLCGTLLTGLGVPPFITLPLGAAMLWLVLRIFGKRPSEDPTVVAMRGNG